MDYRLDAGRARPRCANTSRCASRSRISPMRARSATRSTARGCARPAGCSRRGDAPVDARALQTIAPADIRASRVFSALSHRHRENAMSRPHHAVEIHHRGAAQARRRRRADRAAQRHPDRVQVHRAARSRAARSTARAARPATSTCRARRRSRSTSSPTTSCCAAANGAAISPAWRPRKWRSRTRSRRSIRAGATCWCSIRSTARRTSTSTSRSARYSRCCARRRASPTRSREDFLQPGTQQVCAGYAIYGPSTMLVLTLGTRRARLHARSGDRRLHPDPPEPRIPEETSEFAINASNQRFWEPPVQALRRRVHGRQDAGRAARTSTCAGSRRWWPKCTAS